MKHEMEHKYHTESMESSTIVTKTKPAPSSVCTKTKTASAPPPVYTTSKPSSSVCTKAKTTCIPSTKVETKTVEKSYTKVEVKTVEKPYTKIETKTVEKPASCKSQPMSISTATVGTTLTKTFAVNTCSQAGPTDKPCSCKHNNEDEKHECSCNKTEKHAEEEYEEYAEQYEEEQYEEEMQEEEMHEEEGTEDKCPGYLYKGFEVCLTPHTKPWHVR
jgi:hypothetical protein